MDVLPFAVAVHFAPVSQSGRGMDSISFSCRFKSGREHQFMHQFMVDSPKNKTAIEL